MNKTVKKIGIALIAIVVIPLVTFTVIELNSLNESEEVIAEIYRNQLDAILFSVNQYSEDIVDGWKRRVTDALGNGMDRDSLTAIRNNLQAVTGIFLADSAGRNITFAGEDNSNRIEEVEKLLRTNRNKTDRLYSYKEGGYLKNQPLADDSVTAVVFLLKNGPGNYTMGGLLLDPVVFIRSVMAPRIQEIARDKFLIAIFKSGSHTPVYSLADRVSTGFNQQKKMWVLPGYALEIELREADLETFVKARSYTNLIILGILNVFIIGAMIFVFLNVRREVDLARMKSDFVSNVSHELRTPLALISMFAETLEMDRVRSEEKKEEYYGIISRESGRLSQLVNKILNFSKMESGKKTYNFTETRLNDVVKSVMETYSFHLKNKGFEYTTEYTGEQDIINADTEAVSEAVINLIDNAVKYSGENKKIKIGTKKDNGSVHVFVKDYGIGIAEKERKKIFEKFYRVSTGLVHNTKGTGLGLSLVSHIMEAHNGKVTLESEEGKGSTFRLYFPVKKGV